MGVVVALRTLSRRAGGCRNNLSRCRSCFASSISTGTSSTTAVRGVLVSKKHPKDRTMLLNKIAPAPPSAASTSLLLPTVSSTNHCHAAAGQQQRQQQQQQRRTLSTRPSVDDDGDTVDETVDGEEVRRAAEEERRAAAAETRRAELRESFRRRTGRGWSDPWDTYEMIEQNIGPEDLPEFSPRLVSQISRERVRLYCEEEERTGESESESKDGGSSSHPGVPRLPDLADLPLPPPPPPRPGHYRSKAYALHRKRAHYRRVLARVTALAEPQIPAIRALEDWHDRQEAVDVLFEDVEARLKEEEVILGRHPQFGAWVERALEEFLRQVQKQQPPAASSNNKQEDSSSNNISSSDAAESTEEEAAAAAAAAADPDATAVPIFMDCFDKNVDSEGIIAPKILWPLRGVEDPDHISRGRMIGEWEIAAHKRTRRILLRQSTRKIARILLDGAAPPRIYLHGKAGIGKTAALLSIVASARKSGSIVLFVPEGNQFHQNGFYNEPNERKEGIFDLPILTQGVCKDLLEMHKDDMVSFQADAAAMEKHFTGEQLEAVPGYESGGSIAVNDLLAVAVETTAMAPMCYSVAIDVLMDQDEKHFILAFDEFNCYHAPGHYFNMAYDDFYKNPKSIPYDRISLFKPAMDAMAISCAPPGEEIETREPVLMKRGAVIVATTESKAIARRVTDPLTAWAQHDENVHAIEIPRLSKLEVDHVLANYECTGVGKLRLDQGETVMDENEVEFLRMVSGAEPERLMNAVIVEG